MAFPDVVALLIAHLAPVVAPVPVQSRVPDPRPDEFVQVRRVGGTPAEPVRDVPRIDVIAWAATEPRATEIANMLRTAIWALPGTTLLGPTCYRVAEFMGLRMDDDGETGTPRAWITFELAVRADDVIHTAASIT